MHHLSPCKISAVSPVCFHQCGCSCAMHTAPIASRPLSLPKPRQGGGGPRLRNPYMPCHRQRNPEYQVRGGWRAVLAAGVTCSPRYTGGPARHPRFRIWHRLRKGNNDNEIPTRALSLAIDAHSERFPGNLADGFFCIPTHNIAK